MGKRFIMGGVVGLVILTLIIVWWNLEPKLDSKSGLENVAPTPTPVAEPSYPLKKHLVYSYRVHNRSNQVVPQADFYTYSPVPETAFQKLETLDINRPYELLEDAVGNQIIHFKFKEVPPYASFEIKIKASLAMSHGANFEPEPKQEYLNDTHWLNINEPEVSTLASRFQNENKSETVKEIFLWTMRSIRYSGYEQKEKSVIETLQTKAGDCTDYMHVFTALSRKNQIPTREIGGFIVKKNKRVKADDYHNWAGYYLDQKWHLADPQNKIFNKLAGDYVAFKHYGEDKGSPLHQFHRYRVSDKRLSVLMN